MTMHNKTIAEISRDLTAGEYSSAEITQELLARIKAQDSTYNSFITVSDEQAIAQANAADACRAAGNASPGQACRWHTKIFFAQTAF